MFGLDSKNFSLEFKGNEIVIDQTDGPHSNKSRYFGRIYIEEDHLRAKRGLLYEEDTDEDLLVGKFSGTHAFERAMEAIMKEYEDSHLPEFE